MKLKTIQLILCMLISVQLIGQKSSVVGNIILHIKTYQDGDRENPSGFAEDAQLDIVNVETGDEVVIRSKFGIFRTQLAIGQNYLVKVSKAGFESKTIIITTRGASSKYKYLLRFDFFLQMTGFAQYTQKRPVVCVIHNQKHHRFDLTNCLNKTRVWRL